MIASRKGLLVGSSGLYTTGSNRTRRCASHGSAGEVPSRQMQIGRDGVTANRTPSSKKTFGLQFVQSTRHVPACHVSS